MSSESELLTQLKSIIDSNRTDLLCSLLSTANGDTEDAPKVKKLLNEAHDDIGTLLHYATKKGVPDAVRALLANGADPLIPNAKNQLPLDLASPELRSVYNEEMLQATAQSNMGRVCQLVAAGVDVNLHDSPEMKNTPLHWASCYGNRDIVQCLCTRGAHVNAANAGGRTPLHEAVKRGDIPIIEELILNGADPKIAASDEQGGPKTALDLAAGRDDLIAALKGTTMTRLTPARNGMPMHIDSKRNLANFDASTSGESLFVDQVNGGIENSSEPSSPQLSNPVFKKHGNFEMLATTPLRPVVTEEKLNSLWPQPQSMVQSNGKPFVVTSSLKVLICPGPHCSAAVVRAAWELRQPMFEALGVKLSVDLMSSTSNRSQPHVLCHVNQRLCPGAGAYKMVVSSKQLRLVCGSLENLSYGLATLLQLLRLCKEEEGISIPALQIEDWPELTYRGVLIDISQGRIPTLDTLKSIINTLSLLKINQVYLYARFKVKTPPCWQVCYSQSDLMVLDGFCHQRGITCVPVMEVGPKVQFEDLPSLYSSLQDFTLCFAHSGFVGIGPRFSSQVLDVGEDSVSVEDIYKLVPVGRDQTLQLCAYPLRDVPPQLLQQLPPHLVFNEFGVKADHNFAGGCSPLAESGISFFVCPGTSAWNSLGGCPEAAVNNIYNAVKCATGQGALGMSVCHWTGKGHMTHQPFSWPGILVGAGLGWNSDCHWDFLFANVAQLINQHVYMDEAAVVGQVVIELGRAETFILRCARDQGGDDCSNMPDDQGSVLFRFLTCPDDVDLENLTPDVLQKASRHIKKCQSVMSTLQLACPQASEVTEELQLTSDLMLLAIRIGRSLVLAGRKPDNQAGFNTVNFGVSNLSATMKTDVANKLLELLTQYQAVWKRRYFADCGLQESVVALQTLLKQLIPGSEANELLATSPSKEA